MAGEGKGGGSDEEKPSRKALRLRSSAECELIRAEVKLEVRERQLDLVDTRIKQLRDELMEALDQGNDTSVLRQLLNQEKVCYKESEKRYQEAKKRYEKAEKDVQQSIGGEARAFTDIKPSDYEPLSLESLRESVNSEVELPLVAQILGQWEGSKLAEKVFMRQEYMEFLDAWLGSPRGLMLIGSPGIGKLACSYVALEYKLRESSSNVVVWMVDTMGGPWTYMRWGEMIFDMQRNYRLVRKLCLSAPGRVTFVYDGRANLHYMFPPPFSHGLAIYSPGSAKSFKGTAKEGFVPWCMKAWTCKEVARWAELQGANVELALEIFDRVGGNIRAVIFCLRERAWEESLKKAENFLRRDLSGLAGVVSLAAGNMNGEVVSLAAGNMNGEVGHHVLHWVPSGAARIVYEQFFCSDFVRKEYLSWLKNIKNRLTLLQESNRPTLLQEPPEGFAFEAAVLGHMEANKATRFEVRSLEDDGGGEFAVKELNWERWMVYNGIEDVPEGGLGSGVVYVPRSKTEPCADAFWMDETEGLVFFQVTLPVEHRDVMGDHIASVMNRLNARSAQLWFVTPASGAGEFERQKILTSRNREYAPGNAPKVSQSVAYILTSGDEGE